MVTTPNESKPAATSVTPEATAGRIRRIYTPQEKAEYLALFEQSKLTPSDFCREMGLNDATFSFWRKAAREDASAPASATTSFAEVQLSAPSVSEAAVVTVSLPGGTKLEVNAATDGMWQGLGLLLKTLQS